MVRPAGVIALKQNHGVLVPRHMTGQIRRAHISEHGVRQRARTIAAFVLADGQRITRQERTGQGSARSRAILRVRAGRGVATSSTTVLAPVAS
jgi:hypothetical protein